jgi:hypothetical protein
MKDDRENNAHQPMLIKVPGTSNKYYNLSPFLEKDYFLEMEQTHFSFLANIAKQCQRVVAMANVAELIDMDEDDKKMLMVHLFTLEDMFSKCSVVSF